MIDAKETPNFTPEEIEAAERMLVAERKKLERAIQRTKEKIEELKPKNFWAKLTHDKDEIEMLRSEVEDLEDELIELEAMNGADYLRREEADKREELEDIARIAKMMPGGDILGQGSGDLLKGLGGDIFKGLGKN